MYSLLIMYLQGKTVTCSGKLFNSVPASLLKAQQTAFNNFTSQSQSDKIEITIPQSLTFNPDGQQYKQKTIIIK